MSYSQLYTTEAIVLKRKNTGEADRILTLFTKEHGKIRVIAKGVRRIKSRRAGHLELFSRVFVTIHKGKSLDIVTEATRSIDATSISTTHDLTRLAFTYFLCELVDQLTAERQEHADVFTLLKDSLQYIALDPLPENQKQFSYKTTLGVLRALGFLPPTVSVPESELVPFIERITERRLKTPAILTVFQTAKYT